MATIIRSGSQEKIDRLLSVALEGLTWQHQDSRETLVETDCQAPTSPSLSFGSPDTSVSHLPIVVSEPTKLELPVDVPFYNPELDLGAPEQREEQEAELFKELPFYGEKFVVTEEEHIRATVDAEWKAQFKSLRKEHFNTLQTERALGKKSRDELDEIVVDLDDKVDILEEEVDDLKSRLGDEDGLTFSNEEARLRDEEVRLRDENALLQHCIMYNVPALVTKVNELTFEVDGLTQQRDLLEYMQLDLSRYTKGLYHKFSRIHYELSQVELENKRLRDTLDSGKQEYLTNLNRLVQQAFQLQGQLSGANRENRVLKASLDKVMESTYTNFNDSYWETLKLRADPQCLDERAAVLEAKNASIPQKFWEKDIASTWKQQDLDSGSSDSSDSDFDESDSDVSESSACNSGDSNLDDNVGLPENLDASTQQKEFRDRWVSGLTLLIEQLTNTEPPLTVQLQSPGGSIEHREREARLWVAQDTLHPYEISLLPYIERLEAHQVGRRASVDSEATQDTANIIATPRSSRESNIQANWLRQDYDEDDGSSYLKSAAEYSPTARNLLARVVANNQASQTAEFSKNSTIREEQLDTTLCDKHDAQGSILGTESFAVVPPMPIELSKVPVKDASFEDIYLPLKAPNMNDTREVALPRPLEPSSSLPTDSPSASSEPPSLSMPSPSSSISSITCSTIFSATFSTTSSTFSSPELTAPATSPPTLFDIGVHGDVLPLPGVNLRSLKKISQSRNSRIIKRQRRNKSSDRSIRGLQSALNVNQIRGTAQPLPLKRSDDLLEDLVAAMEALRISESPETEDLLLSLQALRSSKLSQMELLCAAFEAVEISNPWYF